MPIADIDLRDATVDETSAVTDWPSLSTRQLEGHASGLRQAIAKKKRAAVEKLGQRRFWVSGSSAVTGMFTGQNESLEGAAQRLLLQTETLETELADVLTELRDRRDAVARVREHRILAVMLLVTAVSAVGTVVQAYAAVRSAAPPVALSEPVTMAPTVAPHMGPPKLAAPAK